MCLVQLRGATLGQAGPATQAVEELFALHWGLAERSTPLGPTPAEPRGSQSIRVAVTRPDLSQDNLREHTIYNELRIRCLEAEHFIYMENYAIHDPSLIEHIALRVFTRRVQRRPIEVILVIPDPSRNAVYGWLHRITWRHLAFRGCDKFAYVDRSSGTARARWVSLAVDGTRKWEFVYDGG